MPTIVPDEGQISSELVGHVRSRKQVSGFVEGGGGGSRWPTDRVDRSAVRVLAAHLASEMSRQDQLFDTNMDQLFDTKIYQLIETSMDHLLDTNIYISCFMWT